MPKRQILQPRFLLAGLNSRYITFYNAAATACSSKAPLFLTFQD